MTIVEVRTRQKIKIKKTNQLHKKDYCFLHVECATLSKYSGSLQGNLGA